MRTLIEGGDIVAFADGGHCLLRGGVLLFEDDRVRFVGRSFAGPVDRRIDASGQLVLPGLVNIHCHADVEAGGRLIADVGRRDYFHTGYLNYFAAKSGVTPLGPRQDPEIGGRFALAELLRNGCTTVVDITVAAEAHARIAGELGIRAYLGPAYRSADYRLAADGTLHFEPDEDAGRAGLDRAREFVARHAGTHGGRVQGMLFPYQVDTCSPALLRATRKAADELGVGIEIHAGQNLLEFHEILRRHAMTPVEYLADTGLLGPDCIVGHCIISTAHSLAALPAGRDLEILAHSGASVAHCPLVFARRGNALESFAKFRRAGVNVGLGTDTYPRDLISEMRWASNLCKIVERDFTVATAAEVFTAATLGGARALGREDLGRLAPGAKADLVLVSMRSFRMGPYRDPIRALVQCGTSDDVDRVIVDGRIVVEDGHVVGLDEDALLAQAQAEAERLWATVPEWHWQGLTADQVSPPSFPPLAAAPLVPDRALRVGVLGLSHDHVWGNLAALASSDLGRVVAASDPDPRLRERLASAHAGIEAHASHDALLERTDLDAVLVFADNRASVDLGIRALGRGLPVMVETPMAADQAGAEALLAAARAASRPLMVNWPTAWRPALRHGLALVASGAVGEPIQVSHRGGHAGPREYGCSPQFCAWLYDPARNGGGALVDYCGYGAILCRAMLGRPAAVTAVSARLRKDDLQAEDNAVVVLRYPRALAVLEGSWTQIGGEPGFAVIVYGDAGTLLVHQPRATHEGQRVGPGRVQLVTRGGGEWIDPPPLPDDERDGPTYFLSRLRDDRPVDGLCAPEVGRDAQEVLAAALRSAEIRREVTLP